MTRLKYTKHERLWLKSHPDFDEKWLQAQIAADPSIVGLGDLLLIEQERTQGRAGRLDLLLSDPEENRRYEVELMLGPSDPSHIIRTIEYWDVERRRYPAYDHVAVLVAEDITSRFLNVLSLFSGSIPLMAIQLNALKVGEHVVLDFVRVIDQTELRTDDEEEAQRAATDRAYWESRVPREVLSMVDRVHGLINERGKTAQQLNYNRYWIGLTDGARTRNFVQFRPRQKHLRLGVEVSDRETWLARAEDAGLDASSRKRKFWINLSTAQLSKNEELVRDLVGDAVRAHEEG